MPLKVKKVKSGFKVCDDKGKCLSKKPMTKKRALKQELAVRLSTLRKEGKIPPRMTGKGHQMFSFQGQPLSWFNGNPSNQQTYISRAPF